MNKKVLLLLSFCLFNIDFADAQLKKVHADPLIWTEIQVDYLLPNKSFFYFQNQYRHNTNSDFAGLKDSGPLSKLYQIYVLAGYDQKLTDHWRANISARYTFDSFNDDKIFQAGLRHVGKIGKVDFIKRVAFDYVIPEFGDSRARIRPAISLERNFKVGNQTFRPAFGYELFFYNDFSSDDPVIETRTVDRTRLRLALSYKVASKFWISPYFTRQTEYYNVITTYTGEFDNDGNQIVKEQGGKRNRIEPIIGIDLRFILPGSRVTEETAPASYNSLIVGAEK